MAVITGGRVNRFLQKYLGIKGEIVAPEMGPELHPVIAVTDLPTELRLLDSIRSFYAYDTVTGDATHPGILFLENPPGSNQVITIERAIAIYTPAVMGTAIIIGVNVVTSVSGGYGMPRDTRQGITATGHSGAVLGKANNIPLSISQQQGFPAEATITATTTLHLPIFQPRDEWVLAPGTAWVLATSANAETLAVSLCWRERLLEPSELTA